MTAPRLPRGPHERQCQLGASRRSVGNPYAHEDAMGVLLGRDAEAIARQLGLAGRTVRTWRERYDTDHRGPGRTLALAIDAALELGRTPDECAEPLRAILADTGLPFGLARVLPVVGTIGHSVDHAGLVAVREAAEAATRASELAADGLTVVERVEAEREITQALEALLALRQLIREEVVPTERSQPQHALISGRRPTSLSDATPRGTAAS